MHDAILSDRIVLDDPQRRIEANAEVDLDIGDVATVQIRGGRREAQARVRTLQDRWRAEVEPHLAAAGVPDLAALDAACEMARELDTAIRNKDIESGRLRTDIAVNAGARSCRRRGLRN